MASDIIIHPDGQKGQILRTTLNVVASARSGDSISSEESMLAKIWPDWPERIQESINFRIGPCNDPGVLYQIPLGRIIETVLMWAGFPHDYQAIHDGAAFLSGYLNLNMNDGMNQPHHLSPRTIAKATLLFILAQVSARAKGFTRDQLPNSPITGLN